MTFGTNSPQTFVEPDAVILDAVTAKNMFITFSSSPSATVTATLRKNGIDTTLSITTTGVTSATNTVNTVPFAVNDQISMKITRGGGNAFDTVVGVTLE